MFMHMPNQMKDNEFSVVRRRSTDYHIPFNKQSGHSVVHFRMTKNVFAWLSKVVRNIKITDQ